MKKLSLSFLLILFTLTSSNVWSNPGFRDLKLGILFSEAHQLCPNLVVNVIGKFSTKYVECFGIDNIKFQGFGVETLTQLNINMGPIVSNGIFLDIVNELIESDSNIYRKMKKNFDSKYTLNYEYSERDMQLFNEGMKKDLLGVYSNGQVALRINYNNFNNNDSNSLWLHIEYRDKDLAKSFLEENRPNTATLDDF